MMEKQDYDEETARKVCGKMQADLGGALITDEKTAIKQADELNQEQKTVNYEQNGRMFMKVFLIDGSVNKNFWGVRPDSISKNITSAIGKPLVLFKNSLGQFDHPSLNDKSVDHALAFQDLYRVGVFVDVHESPTHKGRWYGTAEITDDDFRRAVKEDPTIPFYVSPTIRILRDGQNDQDLTEWSFFHSAIVDRPAFGQHTAYLGSSCTGDSQTCLLQLRKASIDANGGKIGCGFCTYKAAKQIQESIKHSLIVSSQGENDSNHNPVSNLSNNVNASEVEAKKEVETKAKESSKNLGAGQTTNEKPEEVQKAPSSKELLETIQALTTKNKELELSLSKASTDNNSLENIVGKLNDEVAKLKEAREAEQKESRLKEITDIVQGSLMFRGMANEDRQKQIDDFMNGGMTLDRIKGMLIPMEQRFKAASLQANAQHIPSRLPLGNNRSVSDASKIDTKSASIDSDEIPYYLQLPRQMFRGKATANEGGAL